MAFTYVVQPRYTQVSNLTAAYVVETQVTDRGDLPDTALFVMQIEDALDPQGDTLKRVARVGDLLAVTRDRPTAVATGESLYRTSSVVTRHDLITDASTAAQFVVEQLNLIATEYQTFLTSFSALPGQTFALPQAAIGVLQPAIDAYVAKKAEREAQTASVTTLRATCSQTSTDLAVKQAEVDALSLAVTSLRLASTTLGEAVSSQRGFLAAHTAYAGLVRGTLNEWTAVRASVGAVPQAAMDVFLQAGSGSLAQSHEDMAVRGPANDLKNNQILTSALTVAEGLRVLEARIGTSQAELATLATQSAQCAKNVANAVAVEEALRRQEQALLAEVKRLCPDYT